MSTVIYPATGGTVIATVTLPKHAATSKPTVLTPAQSKRLADFFGKKLVDGTLRPR